VLAPTQGAGLDLLTICAVRQSLAESAEALLGAEPGAVRAELDYLEDGGGRVPRRSRILPTPT
jgi:hypothetical protein